MLYIPIKPENWEKFLDPRNIYLGFWTEAWSTEAEMVIDPRTGEITYRGLALRGPEYFAVLPNLLIPYIFKQTWNYIVDKVANSGIGKILDIEPGFGKNPFRIEFILGFGVGGVPEIRRQATQAGSLPKVYELYEDDIFDYDYKGFIIDGINEFPKIYKYHK